ncbi:ABC transporter substrate-binding protein [Paenibacillus contaminans]|nr:ABC transporter substrate-binding protein [Paenibacillus contaminans]
MKETNQVTKQQTLPASGRKKWTTGKAIMTVVLALVLALSLFGCGTKEEPKGELSSPGKSAASASPSASPSASVKPAAAQTKYPLTIKDASGVEVTFEKAPEKVVSLAPSETEIIFSVGAGDKVIGVDKFSNFPEQAKSKPQVGDTNTNLETLIGMAPDVVFANSINKKVVDKIRELNIKVFMGDPKTLDQTIAHIEEIGTIMNKQDEGKKTADKMRADKQKIVDDVKNAPKKKVYMEFNPGWTVGDGEFMDELVRLAGGENVGAGKAGWYKIDSEAIIKKNPEIIVYSAGGNVKDTVLEDIQKRPGWDQVDAVKNKKLVPINEDIVSRVGPRLTEALLEIAKAAHPDLVK